MQTNFQALKQRVQQLPKKQHSRLLTALLAGCDYNSNHNEQAMAETARVFSIVIEIFEVEQKEQPNE